jgi:hypothetical protein
LDVMIGLLLTEGINEAYRERSRSLECAAKLDRIGTPLAVAASLRVSMTYYLMRGDAERAHQFRRLLDLKAIENGSSWQVEWVAVPLEGLAAALWTDLLGMRRALDRLDVLVEQEPAFEQMRNLIRLPYLFRRGDFVQVAAAGEAFMRRHAPQTLIGWAVAYAIIALAYVELGNAQRALEICQTALAHVTEADREYFVMYTPLEATFAAALALTGQFERAEEVFRVRAARMAASDEPLCIAVLYEYRVKVARMRGDRTALQQALHELNGAALTSRNPGIVALSHRLGQERSLPPKPSEQRLVVPETQSRTVSEYLAGVENIEERARQALQVLGHYAGISEGYLYLDRDADLQLAASLNDGAPPDAVLSALQQLAKSAPEGHTQVADDYRAYRLEGGFALLRAANSQLPETLLAEVGQSLHRAAGGGKRG